MESDERNILLENNEMLRKLLRAQRWSTFFSALRWIIIIGATVGAYYYLQPYLDQLLDLYEQLPIELF